MTKHYSQPKGFVGRNICFAVTHNEILYGHIVAGSATLHLPGRNEFFTGIDLRNIVNNVFFHTEKVEDKYPLRNFSVEVLKEFRRVIPMHWKFQYGDDVLGFETLIELPRKGECYRRDGWSNVGTTVGYSCKRTAGKGTDSWSGKRIWDVENLKPKLVFCKHV